MDTNLLDRFRIGLARRHRELRQWLNGNPVQHHALEACTEQNCTEMVDRLDQALCRIDDATFGQCRLCEGEVEPERLALDFTADVCLDHYSDGQIRALERDLELAAQVQRHLFPGCVPALPGLAVAAHAQPARIVSGDYYDFFCSRDGAQGIAIADVMGKGLAASMLMSNLQASLRILGSEYDALPVLAARLNELFRYNLKLIRFISLFLMAVDVEAGTLRYCNAGHNPPLWWNARAGKAQWLRPTGPALGILPVPAYHEETISFAPGDMFVLYTDGLVETVNAAGEDFGEERLRRFVERHHAERAEAVLAGLRRAVLDFCGGRPHDDVTLLVLSAIP